GRRDAHRWSGAGRDQCASPCGLRPARDSRDAGKADGMQFTLNGRRVRVDANPLARLLDVLREDFRLTGTKEGCGEGECGACTVLVDGQPVNSCLVPIAQISAASVTTIEGLGNRHPLQQAFVEFGGAQCGICTPGMILAAVALGRMPTLDHIRVGLAGNLCRCTGYGAIYRSVLMASKRKPQRGRRTRRTVGIAPAASAASTVRRHR